MGSAVGCLDHDDAAWLRACHALVAMRQAFIWLLLTTNEVRTVAPGFVASQETAAVAVFGTSKIT
jgi:hypothetical protein